MSTPTGGNVLNLSRGSDDIGLSNETFVSVASARFFPHKSLWFSSHFSILFSTWVSASGFLHYYSLGILFQVSFWADTMIAWCFLCLLSRTIVQPTEVQFLCAVEYQCYDVRRPNLDWFTTGRLVYHWSKQDLCHCSGYRPYSDLV